MSWICLESPIFVTSTGLFSALCGVDHGINIALSQFGMERPVGRLLISLTLVAGSLLAGIGCDNQTYNTSVPKRQGAGTRAALPTLKASTERNARECLDLPALLKAMAESDEQNTEVISNLREISIEQTGNSGLQNSVIRRYVVDSLRENQSSIFFNKQSMHQFLRGLSQDLFGRNDVREVTQVNCAHLNIAGGGNTRPLTIMESSRSGLRFERASRGIVRIDARRNGFSVTLEGPEETASQICDKQNVRFNRITTLNHRWDAEAKNNEIMIARTLADAIFGAVQDHLLPQSIRNKLGLGQRPNATVTNDRHRNQQTGPSQSRTSRRGSGRGLRGFHSGPAVKINASDYTIVGGLAQKPLCGGDPQAATAAPTVTAQPEEAPTAEPAVTSAPEAPPTEAPVPTE